MMAWEKYGKFHVTSFKEITRDNGKVIRRLCPYCKDHGQGEPMDVYDCKNEAFIVVDTKGEEIPIGPPKIKEIENAINGTGNSTWIPVYLYQIKVVGQCGCYSDAHGKRKQRK